MAFEAPQNSWLSTVQCPDTCMCPLARGERLQCPHVVRADVFLRRLKSVFLRRLKVMFFQGALKMRCRHTGRADFVPLERWKEKMCKTELMPSSGNVCPPSTVCAASCTPVPRSHMRSLAVLYSKCIHRVCDTMFVCSMDSIQCRAFIHACFCLSPSS